MDNYDEKLRELAVDLYKIEVFKFGNYEMKSGVKTPIYCDLRVIISFPKILDRVSDLLCHYSKKLNFNQLCGVPYTALPIATIMSNKLNIPMVIRRKEQKNYGTKKLIEGNFEVNDNCLIIEDVVTSGSSVLETINDLESGGLQVTDAIVILDREQGGANNIKSKGFNLHSLYTLTTLMDMLLEAKCVDELTVQKVKKYIKECQVSLNEKTKSNTNNRLTLPFEKRAELTHNIITKNLFEIISTKKSLLCVAVDVTDTTSLLNIAESVGPHICILKLHVDILTDFNQKFIHSLMSIAKKHNFMIMEDRKFADIGNTVKLQYSEGLYKISSWADFVTVHAVPGPGILKAIKSVVENENRSVFILAEMSSEGNLFGDSLKTDIMKMIKNDKEFVSGIVCQSKDLIQDPGLIQLTPGVKLDCSDDSLGQQYSSPDTAVIEKGADICVVGRGIIKSKNPAQTAEEYKNILWSAYEKRLIM